MKYKFDKIEQIVRFLVCLISFNILKFAKHYISNTVGSKYHIRKMLSIIEVIAFHHIKYFKYCYDLIIYLWDLFTLFEYNI